MAIPKSLNDLENRKFIESTDVPGVPAVAIVNPDGSAVGAPVGGATASNQDEQTDLLTTIDADTGAIKTAVEKIDDAISGSEMQTDIVGALPAGTNALGKLLPPDIDVTTHANYARKYYTSAGAATDGIVWSPGAGKRWHVVALHIQTSADATITLEDDKSGGDDPVWKGEFKAGGGAFEVYPEKYPLASGEDAADLIITTSAGNVYVTVVGYEI